MRRQNQRIEKTIKNRDKRQTLSDNNDDKYTTMQREYNIKHLKRLILYQIT